MNAELEVEGRRIRVSSLDRVMWPLVGMTKGALIDYYVRVAPALLPHVAGRPLTLHRFPEGMAGESFYQTRCPSQSTRSIHSGETSTCLPGHQFRVSTTT